MGLKLGVLPALSAVLGAGLFLTLLWASWVSRKEGEPLASGRLAALAVLVPLPFFLPPFLPGSALAAVLLVGFLFGVCLLLVPVRGRRAPEWTEPAPGVDERDIMFSRATLMPGTERFRRYYERRPENREPDEGFRKEPGLLSPGSVHFHTQGFAAADAAFWTIEMLRPYVEGQAADGEVAGGAQEASGVKLGGESALAGQGLGPIAPADPEAITRFLKGWLLKMGAHSVGVAEMKSYHLYTHVGRGPDYGAPVELDHKYALALSVEMDKDMVDRAPRSPTAMESALQYVRSGVMAVQIADLIRRLGYGARAHIDGNYRVICPLVARDAGLGELGRMGLLMTPTLGPRVRLAVVTTDLPLAVDGPVPDSTTIDFCMNCRKCAECCPSSAISFADPEKDEQGVPRWKIDSEACFTLWGRMGTDCARCMAVCPYSHPDNALHTLVRWGIKNNGLFRRGAVWMDDIVYGRRPPPKPDLFWMDFPES